MGPSVILGPLVTSALGALQMGVVGGLIEALLGKGLEKERILNYERDVQAGKLLVIVHGTPEKLGKVRSIMKASDGEDVAICQKRAA